LDRKVIVLPTTTPDTASSSWERTWMGRTLPAAVLVFVIAACFAGIAIISNKSAILKEHSPRQDGIEALVRQVSSLHQSDFIVFSDGRVWYVRGVHDGNMEIVGWIGDNSKSQEISSFVLANGDFSIVRRNDSEWTKYRDRYFTQ
jgi:hypothetical protein